MAPTGLIDKPTLKIDDHPMAVTDVICRTPTIRVSWHAMSKTGRTIWEEN